MWVLRRRRAHAVRYAADGTRKGQGGEAQQCGEGDVEKTQARKVLTCRCEAGPAAKASATISAN